MRAWRIRHRELANGPLCRHVRQAASAASAMQTPTRPAAALLPTAAVLPGLKLKLLPWNCEEASARGNAKRMQTNCETTAGMCNRFRVWAGHKAMQMNVETGT